MGAMGIVVTKLMFRKLRGRDRVGEVFAEL
jgi:hypothetical protein